MTPTLRLIRLVIVRKSLRRGDSSSSVGIWLRPPDSYEVEECDRSQSNRFIALVSGVGDERLSKGIECLITQIMTTRDLN